MCRHNANVAAALERPDLVHAWDLAALVISPPSSNAVQSSSQISQIEVNWPLHPFGHSVIHWL